IILIAVVGAAAYVTFGPNPSATHTLDASSKLGDVTEATLELDVGASTVTISGSSDVGADLYRAHVEYSGPKPNVDVDSARGAVSLDADGKSMHGIGQLGYASPGFSGAADGYRIQVNGGACTVSLDTATESG